MSNVFFNWTFDVAPGSTNRSRPVENEFAAIGTGFDKVGAYFARSLLAPESETSMGFLPAKADRANKSFVWDANGNPSASVAATSSEMTAAIAAAASASTDAAAAAAAAASVLNSTSYIQQLMLAQGIR